MISTSRYEKNAFPNRRQLPSKAPKIGRLHVSSVRAVKMALKTRKSSAELIHHSDRGIQYCCDTYQRVLEKAKVRVSMTQNGDPLENAIAERVNGILKEEFMLEKIKAHTPQLKKIIE